MNIKRFKYNALLKKAINEESASLYCSFENKKGRISGVAKLAKAKAVNQVQLHITKLKASDDIYHKLLGKELALEKEYLRVYEKQKIINHIENKTGQNARGVYTLAEIGQIFGLTRERVRQIQSSAEKVLKHPNVAKKLKDYRGILDDFNYEV